LRAASFVTISDLYPNHRINNLLWAKQVSPQNCITFMKALVIQLSDIHLRVGNNSSESKFPLVAPSLRNEELEIDTVILAISGDLVSSGEKSEFAVAAGYISAVVQDIRQQIKPTTVRVCVVPGNHDCILPEGDTVREAVLTKLRTLTDAQIDTNLTQHLVGAQSSFFEARDATLGAKPDVDRGPLYWEYLIPVGKNTTLVRCYNTAWCSSRRELQGTLHFPLSAIPSVNSSPPADYVVSIFHHPYNWMPADSYRMFREQIERTSDLILTGHEHEAENYQKYTSTGESNEYLEGAVFQEAGRAEQSGFHAIYLDFTSQLQRTLTFSWDKDTYAKRSATEWGSFTRGVTGGRKKLEISREFSSWLETTGTPFNHPAKPDGLRLSDIYILPNVKQFQLNRKSEFVYGELVHGKDLLKTIGAKRNVLIFGRQHSGKTTLSKILFRYYFNAGLTPIFIEGDSIGQGELQIETIQKKVNKQLARQFTANNQSAIEQLPRESMVVIIDDFDHAHLNLRGRLALLTTLTKHFGKLVVLGDDVIKLEEIASGTPGGTIFSDFDHFEIVQFGHLLRSKLIEKWYTVGSEYILSQDELAKRTRDAELLITNLIGKNYLPSYPLYVLSLLQANDTATMSGTAKGVGTYGSLYESLITRSLATKSSRANLDTRLTYLSELGFHLFNLGKKELTETELSRFHRTYCEKFQYSPSLEDLKRLFYDCGIIAFRDDRYTFQYPATYYYFVARYIRDNITRPEVRTLIARLCDKLNKEEHASIWLFLTHLSKDPVILEVILDHSRKLFAEFKPARFDEDVVFVKHFSESVEQIALEDSDFQTSKEAYLKGLDDAPEVPPDPEISGEDAEGFLPAIARITMTLRTLEVLGQVIKNFPGSLIGAEKEALVLECYSLGLRMVSMLFVSFKDQLDEFVEMVSGRILTAHPNIKDREEFRNRVKGFMFWLIEASCFGMVKRISLAVGHPDLGETYERVRAQLDSDAAALIDISIQLDHLGFPDDQLKKLSKQFDPNSFSGRILRQLVVEHFYLFPTKESTKQQVCDAMNIKVQSLRQIDAKSLDQKKVNPNN
jgi:hypothetical protein